MTGWESPWKLLILLLLVLLLFGPKRLPEMGRSLGKGMREFKDSLAGKNEGKQAELPPSTTPPPPAHETSATTRAREPDPPA